jgi:hypothetical protein
MANKKKVVPAFVMPIQAVPKKREVYEQLTDGILQLLGIPTCISPGLDTTVYNDYLISRAVEAACPGLTLDWAKLTPRERIPFVISATDALRDDPDLAKHILVPTGEAQTPTVESPTTERGTQQTGGKPGRPKKGSKPTTNALLIDLYNRKPECRSYSGRKLHGIIGRSRTAIEDTPIYKAAAQLRDQTKAERVIRMAKRRKE